MTRAKYIADTNELQELAPPEPTKKFEDLKDYVTELKEYRDRQSTLRLIPCDNSCREVFKDNQEYEEGKDYKLYKDCAVPGGCVSDLACKTCEVYSLPITVKTEDDLWDEVVNILNPDYYDTEKVDELKKHYTLIKK